MKSLIKSEPSINGSGCIGSMTGKTEWGSIGGCE